MHRLATRRRTKLISQAFTNRACKPQQALPRFNKLTTNLLPFAFQQKLQLNKLSLATRVPSTSNSLVFTSRFNGSTHTQPVIFTTWTHNRQFSSISGPRKQKESGYNTNNKQQQKPEVDEEFAADPVETLPPELQALEPTPTSVKVSVLVALLLVAVAIPWGSWIDHVFFPPDDDDDD